MPLYFRTSKKIRPDFEDDYFYLDYTDQNKGEIEYAGITCKVSYKASGIGAAFMRLLTLNKTNKAYQNMEPLLLYEENAKEIETETRRTFGGGKL